MRFLGLTVCAVISCLGVTSCALAPGSKPGPTADQGTPLVSPNPTATSGVPRAKTATLDPGLVSGAAISTFSFADIHSDVMQAPAFPGLALAQEGLRNQILQNIAWAGKKKADLKWQLNSAGADVAVFVAQVNSGDERHFATVVYDASTDQAYNSNSLIEPARWKDLVAAVDSSEGGAEVAKLLKDAPYPLGRGAAFSFAADGGLIVHGGTDVKLASDKVSPLLTPLGKRAMAGAVTPAKTQPVANVSPPPQGVTGADVPDSGRPGISLRPDCQSQKCIALTFDDGPAPETSGLVETLRSKKVPATFFTLGRMVQARPNVVKQTAASGNQVGWHTVTHRDLVKLAEDAAGKEISSGASVLSPITGSAPLLFRPPYGSHSAKTDGIAGSNHMASVFWNIDTRDWDKSKVQGPALTQAVISSAVAGARPGAIILLHDVHDTSRAAVGTIIDQLRAKGYTFVTVGDLPGARGLSWGKNFCLSHTVDGGCS